MISQAIWTEQGQAILTSPDPVMADYTNAIMDIKRSFINRLVAKALEASRAVDAGQCSVLDIDEELKKLGH